MTTAASASGSTCGEREREEPLRPEHGFVTEWCIDVEPLSVERTPETRSAVCADGERECSRHRPCERHST